MILDYSVQDSGTGSSISEPTVSELVGRRFLLTAGIALVPVASVVSYPTASSAQTIQYQYASETVDEYIEDISGIEATDFFAVKKSFDYSREIDLQSESSTDPGAPHEAATLANIDKIEKFRSLPSNWDGYGAPSFSNELIDLAKTVAANDELAVWEPEVFPTGLGSIQFEFDDSQGREVELEIFHRTDVALLMVSEEDEEIEEMTTLVEALKRIDEFLA